jgi:PAS domain-containing protein
MSDTDICAFADEAFCQALDALSYSVIIHDEEMIRYANSAALQLLKATTCDLVVGLSFGTFIHPDGLQAGLERRRLILEHGHKLQGVPIKMLTCGGDVIYVRGDGAPLQVDGKTYVLVAAWPDHMQDRR